MEFNKIDGITLRSQIENVKVALLPVGAVEIHGPHLPTGTDSFLAEALCKKICEKTKAMILPTIHYTQVWSLGDFVGSIGISNQVLTLLLTEILLSTYENGFQVIAIVNSHLGNLFAIKEAAREVLKKKPDCKILYFTYPKANEKLPEVMESSNFHGGFFHADEIETSYMLYLCNEYVDMEKAKDCSLQVPELIDVTPIRWSEFTDDAVMGNAKLATKEKGKIVIDHVIDQIVNNIEKVKKG